MKTLGVDLAAQPQRTAACILDWRDGSVRVDRLTVGISDDVLLDLLTDPHIEVAGIDVPFGWADAFVDLLNDSGTLSSWSGDATVLRLRVTDRFVCEHAKVQPLSVSASLLGTCAMRWRLLRKRLPTPHARLCEVYPAAALKCWSLPCRGYKKSTDAARAIRSGLVECFMSDLGVLVSEADQVTLGKGTDALDALISAVIARAVAIDGTMHCPDEHAEVALREGWIELPTVSVRELVRGQHLREAAKGNRADG